MAARRMRGRGRRGVDKGVASFLSLVGQSMIVKPSRSSAARCGLVRVRVRVRVGVRVTVRVRVRVRVRVIAAGS